jgi:cellulose biosynthesis protein BcsQ
MNTRVIAFFNNKGGVGKTSLVYHLAWAYADLGLRIVAADLDPQANLSAAFLDEDRLDDLWTREEHEDTVYGAIRPLLRGVGDVAQPHLEDVSGPLSVLVGDLSLSTFEDALSQEWPNCMDGQERSFRVLSAIWRILQYAARFHRADMILTDLGPNLGAINRAALIAADHVVIPMSPDIFSLQGLRNLGPTLRKWRGEWQTRLPKNPAKNLDLPRGDMLPAGYIVLQHSVRLDRPVKAYDRWIQQIPIEYRKAVLDEPTGAGPLIDQDPHCLKLLKHYRSLMPLAQEARKPVFHLRAADGAIGSHLQAAQQAGMDFRRLAEIIASRLGVPLPVSG